MPSKGQQTQSEFGVAGNLQGHRDFTPRFRVSNRSHVFHCWAVLGKLLQFCLTHVSSQYFIDVALVMILNGQLG